MTTLRVNVAPDGVIVGAGPVPLPGVPSTLSFTSTGLIISAPQIVPVRPVAAQRLSVTLNQQDCLINLVFKQIQVPSTASIPTDPPVFEKINTCFLDLYVENSLIVGGVLCQNNNLIVRDRYLGFVGDLAFVDTHPPPGTDGEDPRVDGLGSRWLLTYWPLLA